MQNIVPQQFIPQPPMRFYVISEQACPLYEIRDEFEVEGHCLTMQAGKSICLILTDDIVKNLKKQSISSSQSSFTFQCSGCKGTISVTGRIGSDLFSSLDRDQQHHIEVLIETLGRFSLFKTLSEQDLRKLLPEIKAGHFEAGTTVLKQGELGEYLYIIESGSTEVLSGKNDEILITVLNQGEIFGEMSLLSGAPCSATIRVREDSKLLAIDGTLFTKMVTRFPSLQMYLFRLLTHRLRETNTLKESEFGQGIRGNLDDLQIAELLQALHMSRKSGKLFLNLSGNEATVIMRNGGLVYVEYGEYRNVDAFFELLKENDGSFSFSPQLPMEYKDHPEIDNFMKLLMEGFVRIDEGKREGYG